MMSARPARGEPRRTQRPNLRGTRFLLGLVLCACSSRGAPNEPREPAPSERLFLGQDFVVGPARCRVNEAERLLTEPNSGSDALAAGEDVLVAKLTLACRDARDRALDVRSALPDDALVQLVTERGALYAPSSRTRASAQDDEALVFELPPESRALLRGGRFDAHTGRSLGMREPGDARLRLGLGTRRIEVSLREAAHDGAFEAFLGQLARDVVAEGEAEPALRELRASYGPVAARLGPRALALRRVEALPDGLRVTLALERSSLRDVPDPVAEFVLHVVPNGGGYRLAGLIDSERTRERAACAEALHALGARVEDAFRGARAGEPTCNALGVLLPGSCEETPLLVEALATRARCIATPWLGEPRAERVPDDFQLTLKRGHQTTGLDRDPRYVLALFAEGQVVFHGRHWVNESGRSDGRTSRAVLALLLARFEALDWFERKGGTWDPERCGPDDELGHVLTLHAAGRERMVVDRDGCRGPFSARELDAVLEAVEAASGVSAWTTPLPAYVTRDVQEWTILGE